MVLPTSGTGGSFALPAPAIQVTNGAAPCALTANHEVWCWGSDRRGGLGLLTGNPSGPQLLATRADVMVVTNEATLLLNDAGLFQVGDHPVVMAESDAGYAFGAIWLGRPPPARTLFSSSGVWGITSDGMAWTTSIPGDPRGVSPSAAVDAGPALSIGLSGLESIILRPSGTVETRRGSVVATDVTQLSGSCLLFRDGGVSCASSAGTFVRVPLPPGVEQISDGCAFIPPSQVRCWDQTAVVWPVSGIGTGVRRLVGTAGAGCVLIGSNLAQCWGSNPQGNSTPSLRKAVPVVFDEAIADISPGRSHICARAYSGKVWCWGSNSWGQLGITPVDSYNAPVKMAR